MTVPFSAMPLPLIRKKDGSWSYQMTSEDMITLARALRKEERPTRDGVARLAWCYASRLACYPSMAPFARMVTNHSQVINPRWFPTPGAHCGPGGDYVGKPECNGAENRPANAAYPWESMSNELKESLYAWASGQVRNPVPRGSDFAAPSLVARKIAAGRPWHIVYQGIPGSTNSVINEPCSRAWPSDDWILLEVNGRVVGLDPEYKAKSVANAYMALGLAGGAFALWKGWRG